MLVVLATGFGKLGGIATYTFTVAEQLDRLGHDVVIAAGSGEPARLAEARGLRVATRAAELPPTCDAVMVQDQSTAFAMAERYPGSPRILVPHTMFPPRDFGPQTAGVCHAVVALNDRIRRRYEALAEGPEVVRLRQPIDLKRFSPLGPQRPRARRAAVFGNQLIGSHERMLVESCDRLGLEVRRVGGAQGRTSTPEVELFEADLVIGLGRCALEGMATARATYVFGLAGGDGWVGAGSYPAIEADGFTGLALPHQPDERRLGEDLAAWTPEMGMANRTLAVQHHDATLHAEELVRLWRRVGAAENGASRERPRRSALDEMARLVRLEERAERRSAAFANRTRDQGFRLDRLEAERDALIAERDRLRGELDAAAGRSGLLARVARRVLALVAIARAGAARLARRPS